MESLLAALPMVFPAMMLLLARFASQGRIQLHPAHEHAVVLAIRYVTVSFVVCFGTPVLMQALILGASWMPVMTVAVAAALVSALVVRPGRGRDSDVETWVHLIFGGLTGTLLLACAGLVGRIAGLALGFSDAPVGSGPGIVVLLTVMLQSLALVPFCTPFIRTTGVRPPPALPNVPDLDRWADTADLGQALQTDEGPL